MAKFSHYLIPIIIISLFTIESKKITNKQKKVINLAFSVTNKYISFLYISLVSLLDNSHNNTVYNIVIQYGCDNLNSENKELIINLEKIYFNCFINIIDMKYDFYTAIQGALDISAYYRLKLPILFSKLNRIIHLDSDTLILKDLMELYTLNFEGKYLLGRLDTLVDELDSLGIKTKTYINSGVLLMDLYNLRKYNYTWKFMEYITHNNNATYLVHHDQTLLNYICHDKIGLLKPKYHMWPFKSKLHILKTNRLFRIPYDKKECIKGFYDPFIVHYPGSGKIGIKVKGGKYHKLYYEYFKLAEEKKSGINLTKYEKFKDYLKHIIQKIKYTYKGEE